MMMMMMIMMTMTMTMIIFIEETFTNLVFEKDLRDKDKN